MSLMIGIISYLPNDLDKRKFRLNQHQQQLAWLSRILPNEFLLTICQNYEESEVSDCNNMYPGYYIKHPEGIGPAEARNEILRVFYNSVFDHLLLMDDDCTSYPYYGCEAIFKEIARDPEKFKGIDAFCSQHPRYLPFKERIWKDKNNLGFWKFTKRPPNTGAQIAVLSNIAKKKGKFVYHQSGIMDGLKEGETDFSKVASEDVSFHLDWIKEGLNYFTLEVLQLCESTTGSTIFSEKVEDRIYQEKMLIENFVDKNKDCGLQIKGGKVNWSKVFGFFDKTPEVYYVRRKEALGGFADNLVPKRVKQEKDVKKKLF